MAEKRGKRQSSKSAGGKASKPKAKASSAKSGSAAGSSQAKRSAASKKAAQTRKRAANKRSAAAKKGAATRAKAEPSGAGPKAAPTRESGPDMSAKSAEEMREALSERLIDPLGLVMLTRERIEEAVSDAVTRGRVTADDAQDLVASLIDFGRKQTNDVLEDLEQLLGRGRDEIEGRTSAPLRKGTDAARRARQGVEGATTRARKEASGRADPVIAQADRARRAAGLGPSFPILQYDELTVAQVQGRLEALTPAELRKVRDYERRHANRKTVLSAIAEKLG